AAMTNPRRRYLLMGLFSVALIAAIGAAVFFVGRGR
ncbi:MAG: hypothetical protein HW378_3291, partial [Anaerolineales bacterium]|nr:hypothetical protein [Anaerolineales bacterium]